MKEKMRMFIGLIAMAMTMMTMTSCEDEMISSELQGIWRGEVAEEYFNGRYGHDMMYTEIELQFFEDPFSFTKGSGIEVDYYGRRYTECRFRYEVKNRVIYLDYNDGTHVMIYNWRMRNGHFIGDFHDYRTGDFLASFNLYKVADYSYEDSYYYDPYDPWYYGNAKKPTPQKYERITPEEARKDVFMKNMKQMESDGKKEELAVPFKAE